jgi:hypothetical protein
LATKVKSCIKLSSSKKWKNNSPRQVKGLDSLDSEDPEGNTSDAGTSTRTT